MNVFVTCLCFILHILHCECTNWCNSVSDSVFLYHVLKSDLHLESRECNESGVWWIFRLSDSKINSDPSTSNISVQVHNCDESCPAGHFIDFTSKKCTVCPVGTFSKGEIMEISDWSSIPSEMLVDVTYSGDSHNSCERSSWTPQGRYLLGRVETDCVLLLSMKINNLKEGVVSFVYNIEGLSTMAVFSIRNERCAQLPESSVLLRRTGPETFSNMSIKLPKGRSILQWSLFTVDNPWWSLFSSTDSTMKLSSVTVTGTPPILQCSRCPPGTYGDSKGQVNCKACDANTFSSEGSSTCSPCERTKYSKPGSSSCTPRSPCTSNDYIPVWKECDSDGKTRKDYEWIQPMICDNSTGVKLPAADDPVACKPCPRGTVLGTTGCDDCLAAPHSSSSSTCDKCSDDHVPVFGLSYSVWSRWPPHLKSVSPMLSASPESFRPWTLNMDYISASLESFADTSTSLTLSIPYGFVREYEDSGLSPFHITKNPPIPNTQLIVEFEVICRSECLLTLTQIQSDFHQSTLMVWNGNTSRRIFTFTVSDAQPVNFSWTFQTTSTRSDFTESWQDHVRIYRIEVTNAYKLGVIGCRKCLKGIENDQCVKCPPGLFYETRWNHDTHQEFVDCTRCPPNTIAVSDAHTVQTVAEACIPCEPGTKPVSQSRCIVDETPSTSFGMMYNLTSLFLRNHTVQGLKLFTPSGTRYNYEFHLTLAYGERVRCRENTTDSPELSVDSLICRHTVVHDQPSPGHLTFTQPLSLADRLIRAAPSNHSPAFWKEVNENLTRMGWTKDSIGTDLHYMFDTQMSTSVCPKGRFAVVTLRCDLGSNPNMAKYSRNNKEQSDGVLELPPNCPSGTCDGCVYHFLWTSIQACPICTVESFSRFPGECRYGKRRIYLIAPTTCRIPEELSVVEVQPCPLLSTGQSLAIIITFIVVLILSAVIFICYRKNKKLEYKYMKLVQSQTGKNSKAGPTNTSCAIEETIDNVDTFGRRSVPTFPPSGPDRELIMQPSNLVKSVISKTPMPKFSRPRFGPIIFRKTSDDDFQSLPENEVIQ